MIRHISAQRKRKLNKLGEYTFWDSVAKRWAWDQTQSRRVIERLPVQQNEQREKP